MSDGGHTKFGILLVIAAMLVISVNDVIIKSLSGDYPLHQMIFVRSAIGLLIALGLLQIEGGWQLLKTRHPVLHMVRAFSVALANMLFFAAIASLPLGLATGLFFVAPLFITLLSIPVLGAQVGPRRLLAVGLGLVGVAVMTGADITMPDAAPIWALALPIAAAFCYAGTQILTAKLGVESRASAMVVYIQAMFLGISIAMFAIAGDGRFATGLSNDSLQFLLRAWVWPAPEDHWRFAVLGVCGAIFGYAMSQAYRIGAPASLAPFEYVALPLAFFWGWVVFAERPGIPVWIGAGLIAGAGIFVLWREGQHGGNVPAKGPRR
ncbi:MAG: DMT family transporter [Pseudomonadota bacterium]